MLYFLYMVPINFEYDPNFLKDEVRDGHLVTSDMKKLWLVELDMVNKFIQVCDKYGLRYFADAGTLLGAVRHGGFIPWDDDVDLIMMREDFNKFKEIARDEFKYPYYVELDTLNPDGILTKIYKLDTTKIPESKVGDYAYSFRSISIDIFCLDYGPETREEQKVHHRNLYNIIKEYKKFKFAIKRVYHDVRYKDKHIQIFERQLKRAYDKFDLECQKYKDTKFLFNNCFISYHLKDGLMRYTEDYAETIDLPFEMLTLKCPKGYKRILDTIYTERTGIPWEVPTKNQAFHNQNDKYILDFDNPYTKYMKIYYDRQFDLDKLPKP